MMNARTETMVKGWNFHPMVDSEEIRGPSQLYAALAVDAVLAGMNAELPRLDDFTLERVCNAAYQGAEIALKLAGVYASWADLLPDVLDSQGAPVKLMRAAT